MKKAAFVLALVMLLSCVTGCGTTEGEASVQSVSMICGLGSVGLADRFAGIVSPLGETTIKKDENMTVDTIKVAVGDKVKKGDVLLTYDLSEVRTNLEIAQLELEQLNAKLEDQKTEAESLQKLVDTTSDDATKRQYILDLRQANADILTSQGNIATKKKDIEKLNTSLKNATVTSPVDGEVQSINPDGGTDSNGNALAFMTIVETGGFRIKGYVNENNVSVLAEGTAVVIRSRVSDATWTGSISSIDWDNAVQNTSSYGDTDTAMSSKYPFYVTLDGDGDGLLIGQHVYIEPNLGQSDADTDASAINLPSYFINDADSNPWVWAQNSHGKLEKRSLTLGEYNADTDTYPVTDGLTAEDYIAYPDESLKAGMSCITYDETTFDPDTSGGTDASGSADGGYTVDGSVVDGGTVDGGTAYAGGTDIMDTAEAAATAEAEDAATEG